MNKHIKKELVAWMARFENFAHQTAAFAFFAGSSAGAAAGLLCTAPPMLVLAGLLIGVVAGFFIRPEFDRVQLAAVFAAALGEEPTDAEYEEADKGFGDGFRELTQITDATGAERDPTPEQLRASWEKMIKAHRVLQLSRSRGGPE